MARILVVEDDPTQLRLIADWLERQGHLVTRTVDGQAALDILAKPSSEFDMILSDYEMPNKDGLDLLLAVKSDKRWALIPFILWTSGGSSTTRVTCEAHGATFQYKFGDPERDQRFILDEIARIFPKRD